LIGSESGQVEDDPEAESNDPPAGASAPSELHVEVFYRERMKLPPTATLEVVLEDGAKMDVAAELVARKSVPLKGGPPYPITLEYEPSTLQGTEPRVSGFAGCNRMTGSYELEASSP
jgi:putative lipoprotein